MRRQECRRGRQECLRHVGGSEFQVTFEGDYTTETKGIV